MSLSKGVKARPCVSIPRYVRSGVRSTREVLRYLHRRGVPSEDATRLIKVYRSRGFVDDRTATRLWAEQWVRQGYATSAIRAKLIEKGFEALIIDEIIQQYVPPHDDALRARVFLARKTRYTSGPSSQAKLARLLAARGFEPDLIEQLLGESSS